MFRSYTNKFQVEMNNKQDSENKNIQVHGMFVCIYISIGRIITVNSAYFCREPGVFPSHFYFIA